MTVETSPTPSGNKPKTPPLVFSKVRKEHEMFTLVFSTIPHLILVKDEKDRFVWTNQAAADFYGAQSPTEMRGKKDSHYNKNEEQVAKFLRDDEEVRRTGTVIRIDKEPNTDSKGKEHWLTTIKAPLRIEDGTVHVVVVATFIDKVVALENVIIAKRVRASRQRDMALLAGKLAHKIHTRMGIIENTAITVNATNIDEYNELLTEIDDLKQFTQDFLRLANSSQIKPEETNLASILARALRLPKHYEVEITVNDLRWPAFHLESSEYDMVADEGKLSDVFAELFSNSLKAADKVPHRIWLKIRALDEKPRITQARKEGQGQRKIHIVFEDNGPGIPLTLKGHKLFDSFESGNSRGTGIGLAIVKEVLLAHGGNICENGQPEKGARFEIILPTQPIPSQP
jgi:PAS domain S-box-containing protein